MASKPFDPTFKTLVEASPEDWPALADLPRGPTDVIDADIATVSGAGDKVLRVRADPPYLLHLEFHSGHDAVALPEKMRVRSALLHQRHQLLVHSVAVVVRPEADSPTLTGTWQLAFPAELPYDVFRYKVVRIWEVPPQRLLKGGVGLLPLAPVSAVTEAELPDIIQRIEQRLRSRRLRGRAQEIWSATFILLGLRYSSEFARSLLQGVRGMRESTTYQAILEEGRLEELRKAVRLLGEKCLGAPDKRSAALISSSTDLGQLENLLVRVPDCESWAELFEDISPGRSTRRRR